MAESFKIPFEGVLAYHPSDTGLDCSIPTRLELGWQFPAMVGDEPEWACAQIVEDVASHVRVQTEERLGEIIGMASGALAGKMGRDLEGSEAQLGQLRSMLMEAGVEPVGGEDRWADTRASFAWEAVAETSILALFDTLATTADALDGLACAGLVSRCVDSLDRSGFVGAAGIAPSDVRRALSISGDSLTSAVGAGGGFPMLYRQRWLQVESVGAGAIGVRHFVPGLIEVDADRGDPAVGKVCRAGMRTFLPVGPDVEFRRGPGSVTACVRTGGGVGLPGSLVFAIDDDPVVETHAVCLSSPEDRPDGITARPTPFGRLWEWDATEYARIRGAGGAGAVEGVPEPVDGESLVRFVQQDPIDR